MFTNTRTSKSDALASKKALKALSVRVDQLEANHFIVVKSKEDLPEPAEAIKSAIYLVPIEGKEENVYNEYVAINTGTAEVPVWQWEQVGSTQVDLAGYAKYTEFETPNPAKGKFEMTDADNKTTTFYVIERSIKLKDGTEKPTLMLATENSWDYTE